MKKLNQFTMVGISIKTTNANNQSQIDIQKLWERFFQENISSKIINKQDDSIHVVYTDYEGDFSKPYRIIIGYPVSSVDQLSSDLTIKVIPALNYEIFKVSGKYPECLLKAWKDIWESDLNRAYAADLEIYAKNFNPNDAKLDIYISLKS